MDNLNINQPAEGNIQVKTSALMKIVLLLITVLAIVAIYVIFNTPKPEQNPTVQTVEDARDVNKIVTLSTLSFSRSADGKIIETGISTTTSSELGTEPYVLEIAKTQEIKKEKLYYQTAEGRDYQNGNYIQKIGNIVNGKLNGKSLWMKINGGDLGGDYFDSYLILIGENKYIRFTDDDVTFSLMQPEYPEKIIYPGTEYVLTKGEKIFIETSTTTNQFNTSGIDFLVLNNSCVVSKTIDGRYQSYNFDYPIVNKTERSKIVVSLNDGGLNTESYEFNMVACEYFCTAPSLAGIKDTDIESGAYKIIGKTTDGKNVYSYSDPKNEAYKKMYEDKNTASYFEVTDEYRNLENNKYTYEEFLSYNPVLFWQDAFGNWIKFTNMRFLPMAEKCKPVIYLYPEKDSKVNVQVTPNGGFTKTIPEYPVGGWNVLATPQGKITDLLTTKVYPYLYWSGIGVNYPVDYNLGWLVPSKDVASFLDEKLAILGMNENEIFDFKEYWVPRLSVNKYYQMYFLSKNQIDQMDPLKITPIRPDSIIRVMLTARGLDEKIDLTPQVLPETPRRNGFTVVEWGGVLLK